MELSPQDQTLLVLFASSVALLSLVFFGFILLRWINDLRKKQELTNGFIEAMRKEVGTDGGSTIASRLHLLDDAIKDIQKIAAAKAIADDAITKTATMSAEALSGIVKDLRAMVEQMQRDLTQNQKYNELLSRAQVREITTNVIQAAADSKIGQAATGKHIEQTETIQQGKTDIGGNARLEAKHDISAGDEVKLS